MGQSFHTLTGNSSLLMVPMLYIYVDAIGAWRPSSIRAEFNRQESRSPVQMAFGTLLRFVQFRTGSEYRRHHPHRCASTRTAIVTSRACVSCAQARELALLFMWWADVNQLEHQ